MKKIITLLLTLFALSAAPQLVSAQIADATGVDQTQDAQPAFPDELRLVNPPNPTPPARLYDPKNPDKQRYRVIDIVGVGLIQVEDTRTGQTHRYGQRLPGVYDRVDK